MRFTNAVPYVQNALPAYTWRTPTRAAKPCSSVPLPTGFLPCGCILERTSLFLSEEVEENLNYST